MAVQARLFPQTMPAELHRNLSTAVGNRIRSDIEKQPAAQRSADTHGTMVGGGARGPRLPRLCLGLMVPRGSSFTFQILSLYRLSGPEMANQGVDTFALSHLSICISNN